MKNKISSHNKTQEVIINDNEDSIQTDIMVLFTILILNKSDNIFDCDDQHESGYVFKLSEGGKGFISYLKEKYYDERKCFSIFIKAIEFAYNIDEMDPEFKQFFDGASVVFGNSFKK